MAIGIAELDVSVAEFFGIRQVRLLTNVAIPFVPGYLRAVWVGPERSPRDV